MSSAKGVQVSSPRGSHSNKPPKQRPSISTGRGRGERGRKVATPGRQRTSSQTLGKGQYSKDGKLYRNKNGVYFDVTKTKDGVKQFSINFNKSPHATF